MKPQPDDTIRRQVVQQIIDALGGQGLYAAAVTHGALPCTGAHNICYLFPDQDDPEANVSRTRVQFDVEAGWLRTDKWTVGLTWRPTGLGQSVHFYTIVQPDDTYSVFLIKLERIDVILRGAKPARLLAKRTISTSTCSKMSSTRCTTKPSPT